MLHVLWAAHQCSLPNAAACPRFADQAGALPYRHSFMAVRFFVVLLPVRDLLLVAKHLFVAPKLQDELLKGGR